MASSAAAAAAAGDGGGAAAGFSGVVPRPAVEALAETLGHAEEVRARLLEFLAAADRDALAELPPLRRARAFLVLARAVSALFSVRLRCSGINPDDHPISKELERLSLHEEKLERFENWNKAPLRPSTTLNYQAATRFIQHSLPHLTSEQRESMRDISRGDRARSRASNDRARKKRKGTDRPNIRLATQEFLEKAARELLNSNESGVKGPLRIISDEDDE